MLGPADNVVDCCTLTRSRTPKSWISKTTAEQSLKSAERCSIIDAATVDYDSAAAFMREVRKFEHKQRRLDARRQRQELAVPDGLVRGNVSEVPTRGQTTAREAVSWQQHVMPRQDSKSSGKEFSLRPHHLRVENGRITRLDEIPRLGSYAALADAYMFSRYTNFFIFSAARQLFSRRRLDKWSIPRCFLGLIWRSFSPRRIIQIGEASDGLSCSAILELAKHLGPNLHYDEFWVGEAFIFRRIETNRPRLSVLVAARNAPGEFSLGTGRYLGCVSYPYLRNDRHARSLSHEARDARRSGPARAGAVDAVMLGIDPMTQRVKMDEGLGW